MTTTTSNTRTSAGSVKSESVFNLSSVLASLPFDSLNRTRTCVHTTGRVLVGINNKPEEEAIAQAMAFYTAKGMAVEYVESVPFVAAFIVDGDGKCIDECICDRQEYLYIMLSSFSENYSISSSDLADQYRIITTTEYRGEREVIGMDIVTPSYLRRMSIQA